MKSAKPILMFAAAILVLSLAGCPAPEPEAETPPPENAEVQQVEVGLGEWYVNLSPDTIQPGQVQFNIQNEGDVTHALAIEDGDVAERSIDLAGGESATMMADLPAGEYRAYCPIGDHAERGMATTLTVEE